MWTDSDSQNDWISLSLSPSPLPVPAAVGEVTVSNNGRMDFLSVSWRPAKGDVDSYLVTLKDRERTVHTLVVSKSSPECVFKSLVSGRLYKISIVSRSGVYENHTIVQERTRRSTMSTCLSVWNTYCLLALLFYSIQVFFNSILFFSSPQSPLVSRTRQRSTRPGMTTWRCTGAMRLGTLTTTRWSSNTTTSSTRTRRLWRARTSVCSTAWCPGGCTLSSSAPGAGSMRPACPQTEGPVSDTNSTLLYLSCCFQC